MDDRKLRAAVHAARRVARDLGLHVDDAVILQNSNRLILRLLPCDLVARVAPASYRPSAEFEVEIAGRLAAGGAPVVAPDPRVEPGVYLRAGFVLNFWTYHEGVDSQPVSPTDYAAALERLHAGMRALDGVAPHFTARVDEALTLVDNPGRTPGFVPPDRDLLSTTLRTLTEEIAQRGADEQLLHGEPHPGNLLNTSRGPLFIDFETCCRGPVEFDLAHAPVAVGDFYPGLDPELLRRCRILMRAMVASWRWDRDDQFPDGRAMGIGLLREIREALGR